MDENPRPPARLPIAIDIKRSMLIAYGAIVVVLVAGLALLSVSFFKDTEGGRLAYGKLGSLLLFSGLMAAFSMRSVECARTPVPDPTNPKSPEAIAKKTELIANTTVIAILLGLAFMVVQRYSINSADGPVLGVLGMWGGACLLVGVLSGFLFGVPRKMASSQLEQISDWITKIIVGVGLTQLSNIPHKLHIWAQVIASQATVQGSGALAPSTSFIIALILYFLTVGFLAGYLLTKMFLADGEDDEDTPEVKQNVASGAVGLVVENHPAAHPESGPQIGPPRT